MATVFIVHGAYGSPEENWIPWLSDQLTQKGNTVVTPMFPTPQDQSFSTWIEVMEPYLSGINSESILIGHSIAVAFILRVLEKISIEVAGVILVSGFVEPLGNPNFDSINKSFYSDAFDWDSIRSYSKNFTVYHSDNDPYVSLEYGQKIANELGVDLTVILGAGHFNTEAGYTTFPEVLDVIAMWGV
ncbi:MAG: alpha/beta hydrolase [bacterium]|nr:alpha/beta hydrolase [bacterium]